MRIFCGYSKKTCAAQILAKGLFINFTDTNEFLIAGTAFLKYKIRGCVGRFSKISLQTLSNLSPDPEHRDAYKKKDV
ncbi:MAG: hypothetical protein AAF404_15965, partial [Pseudomonadota bacterium]